MDINTTSNINAIATQELMRMLEISNEKLDEHITRVRDMFTKYSDMRVSEAIPKIVDGANESDVILGIIIAMYASDYYFNEYFRTDRSQ